MAELAIRGHATRGKEVIEILEMLGGTNVRNYKADYDSLCFYISKITSIIYYGWANSCYDDATATIFTLEEFLEKYPYKVGDKVIYHESESEIVSMKWDGVDVVYTINHNDELWDTIVSNLQPYKEAPMYLSNSANKQAEEIGKILEPVKETMEEIKLDIPDGYEFFGIDDDNKVVLTKKQPQYPKTYEECCDILQLEHTFELKDLTIDEEKLTDSFIRLKRCRDAYWKIAGEEMGLDKPWGPDWNKSSFKDVIICRRNNIIKYAYAAINTILAFPTAEMRDAFYENFKGLIEDCKELL
jgi:hypothetical protein